MAVENVQLSDVSAALVVIARWIEAVSAEINFAIERNPNNNIVLGEAQTKEESRVLRSITGPLIGKQSC
jgi:hypothetical protein